MLWGRRQLAEIFILPPREAARLTGNRWGFLDVPAGDTILSVSAEQNSSPGTSHCWQKVAAAGAALALTTLRIILNGCLVVAVSGGNNDCTEVPRSVPKGVFPSISLIHRNLLLFSSLSSFGHLLCTLWVSDLGKVLPQVLSSSPYFVLASDFCVPHWVCLPWQQELCLVAYCISKHLKSVWRPWYS